MCFAADLDHMSAQRPRELLPQGEVLHGHCAVEHHVRDPERFIRRGVRPLTRVLNGGIDAEDRLRVGVRNDGIQAAARTNQGVEAGPHQVVVRVVLELPLRRLIVNREGGGLSTPQTEERQLPTLARLPDPLGLQVRKPGKVLSRDLRGNDVVVGASARDKP